MSRAESSRLLAAFLVFLAGCAPMGRFQSEAFLSESLRGKAWSAAVEIEPRPAVPSLTDPRTFQSFDAGSDGAGLYLLTGLYQFDTGRFEASVLAVAESQALTASGAGTFEFSGFTHGAGFLKFVDDPQGGRLLAVMGDESDTTEVHTSLLQGGQWSPVLTDSSVTDIPGLQSTSADLSFLRSSLSAAFDSVGRAHLAWGGAPLQLTVWDGTGTTGFDASESNSSQFSRTSSGSSTKDVRILSTLFDWTCAFHRDSVGSVAPGLYSTCYAGIKDDINTALLLEGIEEFDAASDQDGNFLILARAVGENSPVSFGMGVDEDGNLVADSEAVALLAELPDDLYAFSTESFDGPSGEMLPGFKVVALGEGKFLAVWAAFSGTSATGTSRLYSSVYDVSLGSWSDPVWIDEWEASYTNHINLSGVNLKGNGQGDAVLAVSWVSLEGQSVEADIRSTLVSRFQVDEGWMPLQVLGEGCGRFEITGVTPTRECTHNPAVALNQAGDALVVFPDQDDEGLFRLKASVFSR